MARSIFLTLLLLLGICIVSCDNPKDETSKISSEPEADPNPPAEQSTGKSSGSSFLDRGKNKVDHDARFREKPPPDPQWITFSNLRAPRPTAWIWNPPSSTLRIANYTLPGIDETDSAELSIIQFAPNEGGDVNANIDRWKQQFRSAAGGPIRAKVSTMTIADLPATVVEIKGEYMGFGASWHRYNYSMITAMIENEKGNIFLRLLGPNQTINSHRAAWDEMLLETKPFGQTQSN